MPDDLFPPHLQQLYTRRSQLQEMLARSRQELDFTDDPKRQMALERDQAAAQYELQQLEQDICQKGLREVRQRKLKRSYEQALLLAQHLLLDQPDHRELQQEVMELEKLEQQMALADGYAARLLRIAEAGFKEIRPKVVAALRTETGRRYTVLVQQIDDLLGQQMTAAEFCEWWRETRSHGTVADFIADEKQGVAERIRQGKVALFLGSGVSGLGAQESELAAQLARQAQYDAFTGSLSSIAEYYRLKFNLGVDKLLENMNAILPNDARQAKLYQVLAHIPARLVLVSSAYDDLLEQAFTQADKPFVRLSAIIRKGKHEVGQMQVEFSDDNPAAGVYPSDDVSTLEKTLADYSILYKIRGTCRSNGNAREALALTESDYFNFAQHTGVILPNYLVAQLGDLGFLFVGYRPRHWEDRLLATVLLKRRRAPEPCFRLVQIGEEPLETVFWQRRSVQPYAMDVQELEQYLAGGECVMAEKKIPPSPPFAKGGMEEAPYPGLRPFAEAEQGKFFGREADKAILVDKILGNRLTLLFAASGVGKSSLLNAAVIPHLKAAGGENLSVVRNIHWADEPLGRLHGLVRDTLLVDGILPADVPTADTSLLQLLEMCSLFIRRPPLVLVLDQFEDFFRYNRYSPVFRPFIEQLTAVILDNTLPVSVVVSMREDFAMEMNAFKPQLPTLLFENYYRLEKLSPLAATQAILDPVRQVGCDYEPELVQHLLADLKERKRDGLELPHQPSEGAEVEVIDPPYLQIVCGYLWRLKGDGKLLRLADYQRAGGVTGILDYFLNDHLQGLSPAEKQLASRAFDYLAAQRGIKMAYPLAVLATDLLKVKPDKLAAVLDKLAQGDMRILHSHERDGVRWYELYHDMYSDSIRNWNTAWKEQRQKRQRLVARVVIGVLLLVLGVLADSLLWLSQNSIFPAQYLLKEQEFRLMDWGLLPEPLPKMVDIPASKGEFQSGELDKAFGEDYNTYLKEQDAYGRQNFGYPPITASLSAPFAIGQYEVTYEQYDYYVWQQHRAGKTEEELSYPTGATRDNGRGQRAVTQVSWNEAVAYTQWLSSRTGQEYRLPTEVEWEYAARAGGQTAYPWGDEAGVKQANCKGCGSEWDNKFIAPVGSFAANAWGLYDTSGNVWEWTCSEWKPELGEDAKQCAGKDAFVRRVIRGGSWLYDTDWVRSSARLRSPTVYRGDNVGFRVLRFSRQDK